MGFGGLKIIGPMWQSRHHVWLGLVFDEYGRCSVVGGISCVTTLVSTAFFRPIQQSRIVVYWKSNRLSFRQKKGFVLEDPLAQCIRSTFIVLSKDIFANCFSLTNRRKEASEGDSTILAFTDPRVPVESKILTGFWREKLFSIRKSWFLTNCWIPGSTKAPPHPSLSRTCGSQMTLWDIYRISEIKSSCTWTRCMMETHYY